MEGESNVWADMLSRGCGHKKVKTCSDPTPAGKTYKLKGSDLHIYIPSWCIGEVDSLRHIPRTHTPQNTRYHKGIMKAFFEYHSTSTIPTERICNHLGIAAEQMKEYHKSLRIIRLARWNQCRSWWPLSSTFKKTIKPVFFWNQAPLS